MTELWPPGSATGVGSLPGDDPLEAARTVVGELPDLTPLPELPGRGPGADMVGRAAALLVDLAVDLQPSGWRVVSRPGIDHRRARDYLARDLDALELAAPAGTVKLQVTGPWTLAASLEQSRGDRVLADHGAVRELTQSLAQGIADHVADVARRVSGPVVVQLDEPALPAVLGGRVPTSSGFRTLRAVSEQRAREALQQLVSAVPATVGVHCCAPHPPTDLLLGAGARFLSYDATLLSERDDDGLGVAVEQGVQLLLGCVPSTDQRMSEVGATVEPVRRLWRRLGFPAEQCAQQVVVTPTCGLAGASPDHARAAMQRSREAGRALVEAPE